MEANGLEPVISNFTSDPDVIVHTKALGALSSLIRDNKPRVTAFRLANGYGALRDAVVREAALCGLLELARDRHCGQSSLSEDEEQLKQVLQDCIEGISFMSTEDLAAAREERQLVDSLWNMCYKKPSSLRENKLLFFPGEDAPPPSASFLNLLLERGLQ
ncbi:Fes1B [Actinidia rufa]|uniref:Fes1B n=1 Tax=Actinidia rufa TaxID=165716 RepID=A0A7J0F3G4_9ERIC|nr:Fes1B [Actinidia rufa]